MKQYYYYCLTAVLILIPLVSISHFIEREVDFCVLAELCNHTWIPECGEEFDYDFRMFIDECDMFEYNCDYERNYSITNYSDCWSFTCPPMPTCPACPKCQACRMGNWVFRDGRKMFFDPIVTIPMDKSRRNHDHFGHEGHNHYVEHIHLRNGQRGFGLVTSNFHGMAPPPDRTAGPGRPGHINGRRLFSVKRGGKLRKKKKKFKKTTTKITKPTKKKPRMKTKRTTRLIIETGTMASIMYSSKLTFLRNGEIQHKVVKYYSPLQGGIFNLVYNNATTQDSGLMEK